MTKELNWDPVLQPGETCWRLARSNRFALIIDAASYFAHLRAAMIRARRTIHLVGWDFDTRIRLLPGDGDGEWPNKLGRFINALVRRRPELEVRVLKWDIGVLQSLGRGATPLFILDWMTSKRVHFRLDHEHPRGACHHQKIAVIDDTLAFCGGIDLTVGRWDTRAHREDDPCRKSPWGVAQPPWHDATAAVDGEAARVLGELARERWKQATGEDLSPPSPGEEIWPDGLLATFTNVEVGIARSRPAYGGQPRVREIEALYLQAIRSAREAIYIESQYLASHRIGRALAERLEEAGGPDVVILGPKTAEGWLEEETMGAARMVVGHRLRRADRERRLRLLYATNEDETDIYVHAKIMIIDDRLLRVGSSNLNNRSMGLDTECDLAVEARTGAPDRDVLRATIRAVRNDLLAEHLGVEIRAVEKLAAQGLGPVGIIDALAKPRGRTLHGLPLPELNAFEEKLAESRIFNTERPEALRRKLTRLAPWSKRTALLRSD